MSHAVEEDFALQEARRGGGLWWLGLFVLPVPIGLAVWRAAALGYGSTDLVPHFLLDLLVSTYLLILLSGPLRGRPPLPTVSVAILLLLACYGGWLYLPAGIGTAAFLFAVTLGLGFVLRWLREHLTLATLVRSELMELLEPRAREVPADALLTQDALTGGPAFTWRRYVAFPVITGLLLAFIAVRVARPLDKRAEAYAVLETRDPLEIGRAFLKAATNGNAGLFTRERAVWFAAPGARHTVMPQTADLFFEMKRALDDLDLQWVDLGSLQAVESRDSRHGDAVVHHLQTYAGSAVAYLKHPERPPEGLEWIDASRPHRGFFAWISPLAVTLEETPDGVFVVGLSGAVEIRLRQP